MKNKILKGISWCMAILFFIGACSLDTEGTNLPMILVGISGFWFFLFGYTNNWFEGVDDY